MTIKKVFIVGTINDFCLETSYAYAAKSLGFTVYRFDPSREINKHVRFAKLGKVVQEFLQPEVWLRKMNRELIISVKEIMPDLVLVVGGSKVLYGSLVTIKILCPNAKLAWIWPDTPANLNLHNKSYAQILDLSATYSQNAVPLFNKLGFANVRWIPLAGDPSMHFKACNENGNFERDISFVGMWRPERERTLKLICENFGHLKIEIYGKNWKRNTKNKLVLSKWRGEALFTKELANYFNSSRININIIDDTNFPAANMRFFEIPTAGGLQLCSSCPEMSEQFRNRQEVVYFENEDQLVNEIKWVLNEPTVANEIRKAGQSKLLADHTYVKRLEQILKELDYSN